MIVGCLEQLEYARALDVREAAATALEVAANGAGDAVFIHLADVHEEFAVLGASVIPLLEELIEPHSMGAEALGPFKAVKSPQPMLSLARQR